MFEEMVTWDLPEVLLHIHKSLPEGWQYTRGGGPGCHTASIQDESGIEVWGASEPLPDERLISLEALGWLYSRQHEIRDPKWVRRREVTPSLVAGRLGLPGVSVPDPEDLDPDEIQAVVRGRP